MRTPTPSHTPTPATLYYGRTCENLHAGLRYASTNHCVECHRIASREWKRRHKDADHRASKRYREKHAERLAQAYRERPSEYKRLKKARRRARQAGSEGVVSRDIVTRLMRVQVGRCAICQGGLGQGELDHIEPLARGGSHADANLQLLCRTCNRTKASKDPVEFMQSLGRLL